jgi:hypothetical protein
LIQVPEYKDLDPGKRHRNRLGVFLNRILCQEENKLLQEAIQLVGRPQVVGPFFDGLLTRGSEADVPHMLAKLNQRFQDRIIWDYKPHDNDIQIDAEYQGTDSFCDNTDVKVVDMLCLHFSKKLARCRGALWFVGETCTTVILPGDRTQQVLFEHNMIAELRKCEIFIDEEDQCEYLSKLRFLCQNLMMQAPIDDEFEAKYWDSDPDDNYSRGIRMWISPLYRHKYALRVIGPGMVPNSYEVVYDADDARHLRVAANLGTLGADRLGDSHRSIEPLTGDFSWNSEMYAGSNCIRTDPYSCTVSSYCTTSTGDCL